MCVSIVTVSCTWTIIYIWTPWYCSLILLDMEKEITMASHALVTTCELKFINRSAYFFSLHSLSRPFHCFCWHSWWGFSTFFLPFLIEHIKWDKIVVNTFERGERTHISFCFIWLCESGCAFLWSGAGIELCAARIINKMMWPFSPSFISFDVDASRVESSLYFPCTQPFPIDAHCTFCP